MEERSDFASLGTIVDADAPNAKAASTSLKSAGAFVVIIDKRKELIADLTYFSSQLWPVSGISRRDRRVVLGIVR